MLKKLISISLLASLLILVGCLTTDYNVRVIYDTNREYESVDSTQYGMRWHDAKWRAKNLKYWSSAGVIVTNWYNIFHGNDWLKYAVDNGFEGTILIQQDFNAAVSTMGDLPTGSFGKEFIQIQNTYQPFLHDYVNGWHLYFSNENIVGLRSGGVSLVVNPENFVSPTYKTDLANLYVEHILLLKTELGLTSTSKVNFGIMIDEYEQLTWTWADTYIRSIGLQFDPSSLGKSYDDYTALERQALMLVQQSNLIDAFYNVSIPVVVRGARITTELLTNTDLTGGKIIGCMFDDVTSTSISTVETQIATLRSNSVAATPEDALLLIAGIKSDVYYATKPTAYAQLIRRITNAGMYFTSGSDGVSYWNMPATNPGDWWIRSNRDSNWQAQVPTYGSYTVGPRKMMIPMSDDFGNAP